MGFILIDELHGVPPEVGDLAKKTILYLTVLPLIDGVVSTVTLFLFYIVTIFDELVLASGLVIKS